VCAALFVLIRRLAKLLEGIDERRGAPAAAKVNDILDDVKAVSDIARRTAERADRAAGWWKAFRGA
jgi:hypothetical protein